MPEDLGGLVGKAGHCPSGCTQYGRWLSRLCPIFATGLYEDKGLRCVPSLFTTGEISRLFPRVRGGDILLSATM